MKRVSGKNISKVEDPVAQSIHNENAKCLLLASFETGLTGIPETHCRYANQALKIALSVQETEKQENVSEFLYKIW